MVNNLFKLITKYSNFINLITNKSTFDARGVIMEAKNQKIIINTSLGDNNSIKWFSLTILGSQ